MMSRPRRLASTAATSPHTPTLATAPLLVAVALLGVSGCAGLLNLKKPLTAEQIAAKREQCFRSYADGPQPPNPRATRAIRAWYQSLTPATIASFDDDGSFGDGAMAHAKAAGVPEADFLSGENPDPSPACGLGWSHEDVGDHRFQNAASAARSVVWRAAFQACSARFDALWPTLRSATDEAEAAIAALPPSAEPDLAWVTYHRAMAAHARAFAGGVDGERAPIFVHTGTPYVVFRDLMQRFAGTDAWFLTVHELAGVSPLPRDIARYVQPLPATEDDARIDYCLQTMERDGSTILTPEQVKRLTVAFDGEAWLKGLSARTEPERSYPADDFNTGRLKDQGVGRTAEDKDVLRLYSMPITSLKLVGGSGTAVLSHEERTRTPYNCKRVTKVTQETADSATISHEQQCQFADQTTTNTLTLAIEQLPPGVTLAVGDRLVFYARRTSSDESSGSKATRTGQSGFRTFKHTATLVFLARVVRGDATVYPDPAYGA